MFSIYQRRFDEITRQAGHVATFSFAKWKSPRSVLYIPNFQQSYNQLNIISKGWASKLSEHTNRIFQANSRAQKAAEFILNVATIHALAEV